jgi:hypothetical protein
MGKSFEELRALLVPSDALELGDDGKPIEVGCKGLIFSCHTTTWFGSDGSYNESVKMYPLKRKSCTGCDNCYWLRDFLKEDMDNGSQLQDNPIHGASYEYKVTDHGYRDHETGYHEDIMCGFVRV